MIIVVAVLIAHFVDSVYVTFTDSNDRSNNTIQIFSICLRVMLLGMLIFIFARINKEINRVPLLQLKKRIWMAHMVAICSYYALWVAQEIAFIIWLKDDRKKFITDGKLIALAAIELLFNLSSVMLEALLFWMLNKMTMVGVEQDHFNPILQRKVPLFVYISHCMLFEEYCKDEGGVQAAMDKLIAARNRERNTIAGQIISLIKYFNLYC